MSKKILLCVIVVGVLSRCDFHHKEAMQLRSKVDSLKLEIETNLRTVQTLHEIAVLLDSIDSYQKILKTKPMEETTLNGYTARMRNIEKYVREAERRITSLENSIASFRSSAASFAATVSKLKRDLESRNQEFMALQGQIDQYRNQNENLVQTVTLQKAEISDKLIQIEVKQQEVMQRETQFLGLIAESKSEEADAYFARALAVEKAADRTRFAPRKKRETRKEALELYRMAASYGNEEAKLKVTELEKKI